MAVSPPDSADLERQVEQELADVPDAEGMADGKAQDGDSALAPMLEMLKNLLKENGELKMENLKISMRLDTANKMIENYRARLKIREKGGG